MLAQSSASGSGPSGAVLQVEVDRLTADNAKLTEELKALRAAWQQAHQSAQSAAMLAGTVKCSGVNKCNAGHLRARFVSVVCCPLLHLMLVLMVTGVAYSICRATCGWYDPGSSANRYVTGLRSCGINQSAVTLCALLSYGSHQAISRSPLRWAGSQHRLLWVCSYATMIMLHAGLVQYRPLFWLLN